MITGMVVLVSALTVYIAVSAFKTFIETWWVPIEKPKGTPNPLHDATIRLLAFAIGAGTSLGGYLIYAPTHDVPGAVTAIGLGLGAALTAIGVYHLETTNYFTPGVSQSATTTLNTTGLVAEYLSVPGLASAPSQAPVQVTIHNTPHGDSATQHFANTSAAPSSMSSPASLIVGGGGLVNHDQVAFDPSLIERSAKQG